VLGDEYWEMYRRFKEFDKSGTGFVNIEDLRLVLDEKSFNTIVSNRKSRWYGIDQETFINELETEREAQLNYGEFLRLAFDYNMQKKE